MNEAPKHPLADTPADVIPWIGGFRILEIEHALWRRNRYDVLLEVRHIQRRGDGAVIVLRTPKAVRPRDRSKYQPHQGRKECARRMAQARGFPVGSRFYPIAVAG